MAKRAKLYEDNPWRTLGGDIDHDPFPPIRSSFKPARSPMAKQMRAERRRIQALRDAFAIGAIPKIYADYNNPTGSHPTPDEIAELAYTVADAMMARRER